MFEEIDKMLKKIKDALRKKDEEIRNLKFEVSDLENELSDIPEPVDPYWHIRQQPSSCRCSKCRMDLEITKTFDNDNDIHIVVKPCECQL